MNEKTINIGILAHADAGKTTITENLLFIGKAIKQKGSVDKGTTSTDFLDIEKERGISIRAAINTFTWENTLVNLIDTPGHVDFSAEVERAISILDAVILVVSSVEGVQSHTITIWQTLKECNIPVFFFINKIDRTGADTEAVLEEIQKELTGSLVLMQEVVAEGRDSAQIIPYFSGTSFDPCLTETIVEADDTLLEKYLTDGVVSDKDLLMSYSGSIASTILFPVYTGSAKNEIGITELLHGISSLLTQKAGNTNEELSALVFRIDHDKTLGKLAGVRIFSGQIKSRDIIFNQSLGKEQKCTQLRKYRGAKLEPTEVLLAGEVGAVSGLSETKIGDILGSDKYTPEQVRMKEPLLTVKVNAVDEKDYAKLAAALTELSTEDPALAFDWNREDEELHLQLMGWIQIEILESLLESRFSVKAKFGDPTVIFRETPAKQGEGYARYWMPKPCWAIVKFLMEPGEPGSGIVYQSKVSVDKIQQKYLNEIERTVPEALKQGIKGWEVSDIKITLIEGEDHEMHTHPGDFIIATYMGIMNGLVNTGTHFLEPVISFKISANEDLLGKITSDITQMRGQFESPEIEKGKFTLKGILPVSTSLDFPVKLSSRSPFLNSAVSMSSLPSAMRKSSVPSPSRTAGTGMPCTLPAPTATSRRVVCNTPSPRVGLPGSAANCALPDSRPAKGSSAHSGGRGS
ncbi:MAG: GTP-binding protein [Bacteroidetes bacterium HGW-Bacteroidetes-21]|nr:MAG: GTP-binding protein [Bacteroidetes bacterium HGW-Bacteroidetes-21]